MDQVLLLMRLEKRLHRREKLILGDLLNIFQFLTVAPPARSIATNGICGIKISSCDCCQWTVVSIRSLIRPRYRLGDGPVRLTIRLPNEEILNGFFTS